VQPEIAGEFYEWQLRQWQLAESSVAPNDEDEVYRKNLRANPPAGYKPAKNQNDIVGQGRDYLVSLRRSL